MARPADLSSLTEGAVLAGRYRLARCLGEGGMGVVWEGTQIATGKHDAIKILKPRDDASAGADAARFLREARIVAGLSHRNIVQVFDYCDVEGEPVFLVMELLEGKPLSDMLAQRGAPLPVSEALALLLPVASAISAAHAAGVVHRDLKPDNIFLAAQQRDASPEMRGGDQKSGGGVEVKVVDFGLAKPVAADALATAVTQTGSVMGTPFYMSPEQVYGDKIIDGTSDVWSLGVVIHECVCGARPFVGDNFGQIFKAITRTTPAPLRTLAPSAPPALEALVARMLAAEKAARPSMAVVVDELAAIASGETQATRVVPVLSTQTQRLPASVPPPPAQPQAARTFIDAATTVREAPHARSRRPWLVTTAVALGAVIVVASGISIVAITRPQRASGLTPMMSNSAPTVAASPPNEGDGGVAPFTSTPPAESPSTITVDASPPPTAKPKPTTPRVNNKPRDTSDPLGAGRF